MDDNISNTALEGGIHYCARHPQRDTELRCNRCERYMCIDCAVRTPVGYTCRECVRGHEDKFFEGGAVDYGLVAATCAVGGALTAFALPLLGGFLIAGFIARPGKSAGTAAQIALQLTRRRRGRYSGYVAAAAVLAGGIASALLLVGGVGLFTLLYLALASSAAYARFKVSI